MVLFIWFHTNALLENSIPVCSTNLCVKSVTEVPIINLKEFCNFAEQQLLAHHIHTWSLLVESKPKLHLYKLFKNAFSTERYCTVNLKRSQRALIAKLRLGVFPINVELGRHRNSKRGETVSTL